MTVQPSILDVRRAEAEAVGQVIRSWPPEADAAARAQVLESLAQEALDAPERLAALTKDVLDNVPDDGTILDYMNRQRVALSACFAATLDTLRATREQARTFERSERRVPSLGALEKVIAAVEQLERETFAHWELFDPNEAVGSPADYISHEEFLKTLEDMMSPEARRELQDRLAKGGF